MAVEAELDRVGQVGADLEERRTPVTILDVEVELVDEDRLAREVEADVASGRRALLGFEGAHPLLGHPHEDHPFRRRVPPPAGVGHLILAHATLEADHRNPLALNELPHLPAVALPESSPSSAGEAKGLPKCSLRKNTN